MNVNGFVTFGQGYVSWVPVSFPFYTYYYDYYSYYYGYGYYSYYYNNLPLIAIFWTDIDTRYGPGRIYYHAYSRNYYDSYISSRDQAVFDCVTTTIRTRYGDYGFWPSMVIVITWENVSPYPGHATQSEVRQMDLCGCVLLVLRFQLGSATNYLCLYRYPDISPSDISSPMNRPT